MTDRAREMYRGMSAVDLARETLGWRGERVRGLLPDEIAQRSLMASSDFPAILAAGANKTLRQGYVAAPRTFKPWVRNIPLPDFKVYNIVRRARPRSSPGSTRRASSPAVRSPRAARRSSSSPTAWSPA